jgi:hypothetical protein
VVRMPFLLVELNFNGQIERWKIKVKKNYTIPAEIIEPRFSRKNKDIKYLIIGRNVRLEEIETYFKTYLQEKGLLERIVWMQIAK